MRQIWRNKCDMTYKKLCEWCGSNFTAKKVTTRFCSHRCASLAYKANLRLSNKEVVDRKLGIEREQAKEFNTPEIMTPNIAAEYLGVHRSTIYRYLENGILKCKQLPGKTIIRKSDLQELFEESNDYIKHSRTPPDELKEFITMKEAAVILELSVAGTYKILKEKKVPATKSRGKHFYSLKHINRIAADRKAHSFPEITEWYTCQEIMRIYDMTEAAVSSMAYDYNIPRKKVGRIAHYSKLHIDAVKTRGGFDAETYYTVEECMKKYNFTRDVVYHYLRYYKVERVRCGKYVRFKRTDFDNIFKMVQLE